MLEAKFRDDRLRVFSVPFAVLTVLIMSRTHFKVDLPSIVA